MAEYYVRASGGSDSNDGLSFANGWATIQYANDNALFDDIVYICSDGIHYPTAAIDFTYTGTTANTPILYKGVGPTGADDGSRATISGASLPATTSLCSLNVDTNLIFENLRFTAATDNNINIGSSFQTGTIFIKKCRIDNAVDSGVRAAESHQHHQARYYLTEIDNNGDYGIQSGGTNTGRCSIYNCSIHDNALDGVSVSDSAGKISFIGNLFYNNLGSGIGAITDNIGWFIVNNVFFNNSVHGIYLFDTVSGAMVISNNILRLNGGYGIMCLQNTYLTQFSFCDYNCSSGNTSGHININSGVLPGDNNVLADPLFTSETTGLEDFTLQSGSPCLNVGYGYNGV